jgi:hypothetical protein
MTKEIDSATLRALPQAIWLPGEPPSVYHGSPAEMVAEMAREMGTNVTVREAVERLCAAIATYQHVVIAIPGDVPDDTLARLFVFALLDTGMAKRVPSA